MNRKPVFDSVRHMLGRGFRHGEIAQLDRAIDCAIENVEHCDPVAIRAIGPAGTALIKQFEGLARLRDDGLVAAYPDPGTGGEPWTIGWGATGRGITRGTLWTRAQCDTRLERDLVRYADDVSLAIGDATTSQNQFDALVSFHYNTGAIGRATLTKRHRAGECEAAASEFGRWIYAGGRILNGLVRRRTAEAALYRA
ncbi:MAG: lysozyme [Pontixanthobacter sp.]